MQSETRNRWWLSTSIAAAVAFGGPALAQTPPAPTTAPASPSEPTPGPPPDGERPRDLMPDGEPAYTLAQAEGWRDAVVPHVERAAGRSFTAPPAIVLVDREALVEAIVEDSLVPTMALAPQQSPDTAKLMLGLEAIPLASALPARYHRSQGVVQLAAGNLTPLLELGGEGSTPIEPLMKLILAHELAHVLHAQHVDVTALAGAVRTTAEYDALQATEEGFGMLVQERVAAALEIEDVNAALLRVMSMENAELDPSVPRLGFFSKYYEPGLAFFRHHADAGGTDRVWTILAKPPITVAQIRHPETYGAPVEMEVSLERLFRGLRTLVGADAQGWRAQMVELAPEGAAVQFDAVDPAIARVFREDVKTVRTNAIVKRSPTGPQLRALSCYELERPEAGSAVIEAIVKLKDAQFKERFVQAAGITTTEDFGDTVPGVEADHAMRSRLTINTGDEVTGGLESLDVLVAAAHRGHHVAQITSSGGDVGDAAAGEVIATLLDRLETGAALIPVEPTDSTDSLAIAIEAARGPLPEGKWKKRIETVEKSGLANVIGEDVQGTVVLEMSYIDARLGTFEEPSRRQLLGIMLVQLSEAPAAELFGAAMTRGMEARLQRMASFPGASVELAEAEERVLDDGVQLWSRGAMVTMPDREPDSMTMYVARQGPFVAHVTTTGAEMTPEVVAAAARALFAALPDE